MNDILKRYKNAAFGTISLDEDEQIFYNDMNNHMIKLFRALPSSVQTEAILFIISYTGNTFGKELNLLSKFYTPLWSTIYWIAKLKSNKYQLNKEEYDNLLNAHANTMFLHAFDDHLNDDEIVSSHLTILIRSQAWYLQQKSIEKFIPNIKKGRNIADEYFNNYYNAICSTEEFNSIEEYSKNFRNEMATVTLFPVLTSIKLTKDKKFTNDIKNAYESFGIAWRLLDDLTDIEDDINNSALSGVYYMLPEEGKRLWKDSNKKRYVKKIYSIIEKNKIGDKLVKMIIEELKFSSKTVKEHGMHELADQFNQLGLPLENLRL
jgi:hypothetical protein